MLVLYLGLCATHYVGYVMSYYLRIHGTACCVTVLLLQTEPSLRRGFRHLLFGIRAQNQSSLNLSACESIYLPSSNNYEAKEDGTPPMSFT